MRELQSLCLDIASYKLYDNELYKDREINLMEDFHVLNDDDTSYNIENVIKKSNLSFLN